MLRIPASGSAAPVTQIVAVTIIATSFAEFMHRNYCETTGRTIRLFSVPLLPDDIEPHDDRFSSLLQGPDRFLLPQSGTERMGRAR
jgi:hypothetical protein